MVHNCIIIVILCLHHSCGLTSLCGISSLIKKSYHFCCRKMDEIHRQVLQENLTYLQNNLSPENVLDKLFVAGIICPDQLMRLRKENETSTKSCVRELVVYMLPKAGSTAFAKFIEAVQASQHFVSDHLLGDEKQKMQQRLCAGNLYTV